MMISDEEIGEIGIVNASSRLNFLIACEYFDVYAFAREIERISRQQQRESDAALSKRWIDEPTPHYREKSPEHCYEIDAANRALGEFAEAILANKEQP